MCHGNMGEDWYDVNKAITDAPGSKLSGATPDVDVTGFSQSAGRQVTSDLSPGSTAVQLDNTMSKEKFRNWYDPMFKGVVEDPISGMTGAGDLSSMDKFVSASDVLSTSGLADTQASKLLGAAGEGALLLKSDEAGFRERGIKLEGAESQFESEERAAEEGLLGAEEQKKQSLLENRISRQKAQSESIPEYEKSRANLAKSGMAYSGPAMAAVEASDEAKKMDMGDLARESSSIMKDYRDTKSLLEGKKTEAQGDIDRERELFSTGLAGMLQGTAAKAEQFLGQASGLPQKWRQFGEQKLGGLVGKEDYGGGIGGADMFEETLEQSDSIGDLRGAIGAAESASQQMQNVLLDPSFFAPEGENV
mgnify:FL=1